ncbi:MAG: hypothetical protein IPO90_10590 [Flavobacteriales bacterium]|nr:hypothetical protein [Flavobacteriales bacterium]
MAQAQLQRIVLQGSGAPQVFTDINAALAAAQPNDKLYFSGGVFLADTGFTVSIPLHFIGAGMHPDSTNVTGATILVGGGSADFHFTTGSGGSSFTGIHFNPGGILRYGPTDLNDDPVNVLFERCSFQKSMLLGSVEPAASSSVFDECVFYGQLQGYGGAAVIERCVFGQSAHINIFRPSGLILRNSVVLAAAGFQNSENAVVQNCVFTYDGAPLWQVGGVQITNCIINNDVMFSNSSGNAETNTIYNQLPANTFVSETDGNYQFTDDLHLLPGSPGIGAGNDGTDIGIYGTSSPFKPGNVPYNPHYRQASIATATDANGDLPVTIKVATQPN